MLGFSDSQTHDNCIEIINSPKKKNENKTRSLDHQSDIIKPAVPFQLVDNAEPLVNKGVQLLEVTTCRPALGSTPHK